MALALILLLACASPADKGGGGSGDTGAAGGDPSDPDVDGDGWPASTDCDDADDRIHPGADETCSDGVDQDCDGADVGCTGSMPVTSSPGHLEGDETTAGLALDVAVITDWDAAAQHTIVVGAPFTSTSAYYVGAVFGVTSADFQAGGAITDRAAWRLEGSALPDEEVGEFLGVSVAARAGVAYVIDPARAIGRDPVEAADTAIATFDGDNRTDLYLGLSVANGGDLDGDGWTDAVVGGLASAQDVNLDRGRVYVFPGPLQGPYTTGDAVLRVDGTTQHAIGYYAYGRGALHGGFDVNGDGFDDWIAGSPSDVDNGYYNRAVLFWGAPWP